MMEWMSRVALELIGQGGLGYKFNALDEDVKNVYGEAARGFMYASHFNFSRSMSVELTVLVW